MVLPSSDPAGTLIYDVMLSSVGPASVTGPDVVHHPSNMDLAMKLHYLRGVYFFKKEALEGLTVYSIKESMFYWLDLFYTTCGRFRRYESGRPYIRCNDCGVRFIEAKCGMDMDEFLELKDCSLHNLLFYNQVIGPELTFSPPVMIQLTWFKCGGMSIGLRWAHVMGDAFAATNYINIWGQVLGGHHVPTKSPNPAKSQGQTQAQAQVQRSETNPGDTPLSVKRVDPVGDYWITPNNSKMGSFYLEITASQLTNLQSTLFDQSQTRKFAHFVSIAAVIWKCLAKIRERPEPKIVTICRNGNECSGNNQILNVVKVDFSVAEAEPVELAAVITEQNMDEGSQIENMVGKDQDMQDYIVYGANLTFVDLEEADLYGLELNGMKPVFANYMIHGVGDEGVVTVLPGSDGGRTVTVTLPENQVVQLKAELKKELNIS